MRHRRTLSAVSLMPIDARRHQLISNDAIHRCSARRTIIAAMNRVIPCVLMRAGTSRGPFFLREWLPADERARDEALIGAIGASDLLQVDGVGGGSTLTSKVAIVSRSTQPGCDVDYLFAQVGVGQKSVDTRPNCGNMLSGRRARSRSSRGWSRRRMARPRCACSTSTPARASTSRCRRPGRRVTLRRRDRHRRRRRHRRADPPELSRRLGRGHRLGVSDRPAHRRHRRPRGDLHRRRDAAGDRARRATSA